MPRKTWLAVVAGTAGLAVAAVVVLTTGDHQRAQPHAAATPSAATSWVAAENARPGTRSWRLTQDQVATAAQLSAYSDRASVLPGESFRLFVSSAAPTVRLAAFRMGWYGGAGARLVWSTDGVAAHRQTAVTTDPRTRMVRAPWAATTTVSTAGWPEGLYLLKLTGVAGRSYYVPVVVRSASTRGKVVILSATATYEAYNTWGGRSLYGGGADARVFAERSYAVSMDRPYDGAGVRKLGQYELGPVMLAESTGLDLGYLTSTDLLRPHVLDGARGLVSLGHDEYWSPAMRAAVEQARDRGTNLAFLGANTAYWRVRFQDSPLGPDRVVVGYKSAALDPVRTPTDVTTMFRAAPAPHPENSLTGLLYECFPARGDLVVTRPDFPLFRGTGVRAGTRIPGLVGEEIDRAYPIAGTPAGLEVLSHSPVRCGPRRSTFSDSAYFTVASGAGTFSTGTMSWALALAGPNPTLGITQVTVDFVRTVTRQLLTAMAQGPMAATVPAVPNLAVLHEPRTTGTGTGGPVG